MDPFLFSFKEILMRLSGFRRLAFWPKSVIARPVVPVHPPTIQMRFASKIDAYFGRFAQSHCAAVEAGSSALGANSDTQRRRPHVNWRSFHRGAVTALMVAFGETRAGTAAATMTAHNTRRVMLQVCDASIVPKARKRPLISRGFRTPNRVECSCLGGLKAVFSVEPAQVELRAVRSVMAQPIQIATAAGRNPFRRYEPTGTSKTSTSFIPFRP